MKLFVLLICTTLTVCLAQKDPPAKPTLAQDLQEIIELVPTKLLRHLILRYQLNDAEFQDFIRVINSTDAFLAVTRLKAEPEIIEFNKWMSKQLELSGGISTEKYMEDQRWVKSSPIWVTHGWQGFMMEFTILFPDAEIRENIELKAQQGGSFTEFWTRVKDLQPLFESFLVYPQTQRVTALLQEKGIDTAEIETMVRNQFGWFVPAG